MIKRNVFVIYVSDTIMSRKKISVSLSVILFIDSAMIKANAPQMSLKIPSFFSYDSWTDDINPSDIFNAGTDQSERSLHFCIIISSTRPNCFIFIRWKKAGNKKSKTDVSINIRMIWLSEKDVIFDIIICKDYEGRENHPWCEKPWGYSWITGVGIKIIQYLSGFW